MAFLPKEEMILDRAVLMSCKAATTVNVTLSGTQTIDGIPLSAGDRCLVKNQSTVLENGIYVVQSVTWTRSYDMQINTAMPNGLLVLVRNGTTYSNKLFGVVDNGWGGPIVTVGVDQLLFVQLN